jgi:hypothetical protein
MFKLGLAHKTIVNKSTKKQANRFGFVLEDSLLHGYSNLYYSDLGAFLGMCSDLDYEIDFSGDDNPPYKMGQVVEVLYGNVIKLGVICALPPSKIYVKNYNKKHKNKSNKKSYAMKQDDNVYLVCFDLIDDHDHPKAPKIRLPKKINGQNNKFKKIYNKLKLPE